ncbi:MULTISPECIES: hypothetical protein [Streptomyces]|uniref:hypothetical protein n=1 Tax=Streptomyces TaxID=1883 RepID=UPI002079640B|nr:hypothetical protein [Streptomyces spororaveus]MCM9076991.1 hypothetical protein [Streptomyces spororaveus]
MPASRGPRSALSAAAVAAVLLAGATGCGDENGAAPAAASVAASGSASGSASAAVSPSVSDTGPASASPSAPASSPPGSSVPATPAPAVTRIVTPPPAPTRLTVAVDTRGGRLALVRGGAPQEFTVTLWNGNSAAYRHVLVAFQMEMLVGEPGAGAGGGSGFLLERFDPASGSWRPAADFRVANDVKPPSQFSGGGPLAREAVRTERYRLRATAGGPTGSSPLVVSFIDTDADGEVAAHVVLGHSTR